MWLWLALSGQVAVILALKPSMTGWTRDPTLSQYHQLTSSRRQISTWSFLAMSSDSSLYFSISSLVCLIFFLRTSRRLLPCTWVMLHCRSLALNWPVAHNGLEQGWCQLRTIPWCRQPVSAGAALPYHHWSPTPARPGPAQPTRHRSYETHTDTTLKCDWREDHDDCQHGKHFTGQHGVDVRTEKCSQLPQSSPVLRQSACDADSVNGLWPGEAGPWHGTCHSSMPSHVMLHHQFTTQ